MSPSVVDTKISFKPFVVINPFMTVGVESNHEQTQDRLSWRFTRGLTVGNRACVCRFLALYFSARRVLEANRGVRRIDRCWGSNGIRWGREYAP